MFTVCPKCTLTLAVTANDLRVGQGYVRCGRCSNVFNALLKLSEAPSEGAAGEGLPELAQADPASTSQIHRAITAAAIDGSAAPTAAVGAPTPPRPAARPASAGASGLSAGAASAPLTSRTPTPALASAIARAPAPAASATPAPSLGGAAARSSAAAAAEMPRRRSSDAVPEPHRMAAAAQDAPRKATTTPAPAGPATAVAAAARSTTTAPAPRASRPAATPRALASPFSASAPPAKEADADAIDQFELVLHTLGLEADGEEPLQPSDPEAEPMQTVENIVLEGDEVTQTEARVADKPLDELDLFTRRLSVAAGEPTSSAKAGGSVAATPAMTRAAAPTASAAAATRRARLAEAARGDTDGAGGATAAARASGRDAGMAATAAQADATDVGQFDELAAGTPDLDIPALRAGTPLQQGAWLAGTLALALLLLAQGVNHWREALAASPTWGHPVTGLYSALGVRLQPHWDLSAYEVRQQGAESDSGPREAIRVRFSLANHATRAQPVPLLRLTLLDRYGRRVAERDLTPADYWPKGRSPQGFLTADERVDTEVQVRDPSADSASFELDVCLPATQGGIHCAGDVAAAGAGASSP